MARRHAGLPSVLDSGIRCGADVMIALALGAQAVLLGPPWVYGMALAGHARPSELSPQAVVREV